MGNNTAAEVAYATSVRTWAVPVDLEVFEPAVTQGDSRGRVCPNTGGTGFGGVSSRPAHLSARPGISAYGAGISFMADKSDLTSVQLSKPRTGYHASSSSG